MKHEPTTTANATATTVVFIYIVCALSILLFPGTAMAIARTWFHGIDISLIALKQVTFPSLIVGFITALVGGWVTGYVFATSYNYFLKK